MSSPPDQELLVRYLLGELPETERVELEQLCLESDEVFDLVEAVEAELADDYVRGTLAGRRRKEFEKHLVNTPGRAEQVHLAKLIAKEGEAQRSLFPRVKRWLSVLIPQPNLRPAYTGVAALALLVTVGWFLLRRGEQTPKEAQVAQRSSPAFDKGAEQKPGPVSAYTPPQPSTGNGDHFPKSIKRPVIATFTLIPGGVRGEGESNVFAIPYQTDRVRFRVDLLSSNKYRTYRASLRRVEGEQLFAQDNLSASKGGDTVIVEIPAKSAPSGMSVLTLSGVGTSGDVEEIAKYVITLRLTGRNDPSAQR